MRKIFKTIALSALFVFATSTLSQASVFVWKDPANDFTISFPDSWTIQTEDVPTTRLRIAGPIGEDAAICRVKAEKDGRIKIYPKRLVDEAVAATLDRSFWEGEVAQYDSATVTDYFAPTSLGGKGDASAIKTAFVQEDGRTTANMYGTMIGSIYNDTRYVVSCTSKSNAYNRYSKLFATIMNSVELESKYHPFPTGYYRDFLADDVLVLPRAKPGTVNVPHGFTLAPSTRFLSKWN
jgi:hypothetical protein